MDDPGNGDAVDLDSIEGDLDRASELEAEEAIELLRSAKRDLETARGGSSIDPDRREELQHHLDQRIREIDERDAYDSGLGAAMNPDDEEAP